MPTSGAAVQQCVQCPPHTHPHNIINNAIEFFADDKHQTQLIDITTTPEDIETVTQELQPNSPRWRASHSTPQVQQNIGTTTVQAVAMFPGHRGNPKTAQKSYRVPNI